MWIIQETSLHFVCRVKWGTGKGQGKKFFFFLDKDLLGWDLKKKQKQNVS